MMELRSVNGRPTTALLGSIAQFQYVVSFTTVCDVVSLPSRTIDVINRNNQVTQATDAARGNMMTTFISCFTLVIILEMAEVFRNGATQSRCCDRHAIGSTNRLTIRRLVAG